MKFFTKGTKEVSEPASSEADTPPAPTGSAAGPDTTADGSALEPTATGASTVEYPTGLRLVLLMTSVFISMFLVALDRLIISTAIPRITDEFHSVTDIGWYGSAYLLSTCAIQLLVGKMFTFYSIKAVFLGSVFLFEVGSAVCGAAPSSVVFIIGRVIAGMGAAGIFAGVIVIIVYAVPLHKRPMYTGLFGAVFGIASVAGPLLGGAFTSNVTWRWCFYINLPLGGVAMVIILVVLHIPDRDTTKLPTRKKLSQFDGVGTSFFIPGTVCIILALQWGGLTYAWSNWRQILLLTLGGVCLVIFAAIQVLMPDTATLPPRIVKQRSIYCGCWVTFTVGSAMMISVYFLPIWFQAIKGVSAVQSGIRLLPMMLSVVVSSAVTGAGTSMIGYYTPFMIFGTCVMAVGAGLLTTLQVDTPEAKWVGYQFLFGWGLGGTFQAPNIAAQTVLPKIDVPIGSALMFFMQLLGGSIFISVGQNVLNAELIKGLSVIPGFRPEFLNQAGATEIIQSLPADVRAVALEVYNNAIKKVLQVALIMACLTIIGSLGMEWVTVKKELHAAEKKKKDAEAALKEKENQALERENGARDVEEEKEREGKEPQKNKRGEDGDGEVDNGGEKEEKRS